ncbi:hypothetical protein BDN72DRAFT_899052 [Pluteus cervinus]|uniref:Uncharacterized protein n=1 Tax=Pluteus cervinus TaxID=181527 RepID=A0ACD3AQV1_9AGAR|nr:hypothetical protein BDN72DRAFT_899052 [Pluteus cervinus]
MMIPELPPEVWQRILDYLPTDEFVRIRQVNRLFHDFAMDRRFHTVKFTTNDPGRYMYKLNQFKNPYSSAKVRRLKIMPSVLFTAINCKPGGPAPLGTSNTNGRPSVMGTQTPPSPAPISRTTRFKTFVQVITKKRPPVPTVSPSKIPSEAERERLYFSTVRGYVGLVECQFTFPSSTGSGVQGSDDSWAHLVTRLWPILGYRLRILHLDILFPDLWGILRSAAGLKNLRELRLGLYLSPTSGIDLKAEIQTTVIPFLNRLTATLERLSIVSESYTDSNFAAVVSGLHHFPLLTHLSVPLAAEQTLGALGYFLQIHQSHLRGLSITAEVYGYYPHQNLQLSPRPKSLLPGTKLPFDDVELASLRHLEVGLSYWASIGSRLPIRLLAGISRNLTSLTVTKRFLNLDEVMTVLMPFSICDESMPTGQAGGPGLRNLVFCTMVLSVHMLDLLARSFQGLEKLHMTIEGEEPEFVTTMQQRSASYSKPGYYDSWKVYDLTILRLVDDPAASSPVSPSGDTGPIRAGREGKRWKLAYAWAQMYAVARCVPTLRSFGEQHHMRMTEDDPGIYVA